MFSGALITYGAVKQIFCSGPKAELESLDEPCYAGKGVTALKVQLNRAFLFV